MKKRMKTESKRLKKAKAQQGKQCAAGPRCWDDVNLRLARLGEIERKMEALTVRMNHRVAELKQRTLDAGKDLEREQESLRNQIERFYWAHRKEVLAGGSKSVELPFGRLGARCSRSVVVEDAASALEWLLSSGFHRYLRTRTEIDREAIRSALLARNGSGGESAELLRCPSIGLRENEEFWYEVEPAARAALASTGRGAEHLRK